MQFEDLKDDINEVITGEPVNEMNEIRKIAKALQRKCEELQVPMIFVMCNKKDGYYTRCLLPGEFANNGELGDHPDRFMELLRVANGFDKENYKKLFMQNNQ